MPVTSRVSPKTGEKMPKVLKKRYRHFLVALSEQDSLGFDAQVAAIAATTGLRHSLVRIVLEAHAELVERHLEPGGPGSINIFLGLKLTVRKDAGRSAYEGINPHTGERRRVPAKAPVRRLKSRATAKFKHFIKVE